jgi:hypothetical protein
MAGTDVIECAITCTLSLSHVKYIQNTLFFKYNLIQIQFPKDFQAQTFFARENPAERVARYPTTSLMHIFFFFFLISFEHFEIFQWNCARPLPTWHRPWDWPGRITLKKEEEKKRNEKSDFGIKKPTGWLTPKALGAFECSFDWVSPLYSKDASAASVVHIRSLDLYKAISFFSFSYTPNLTHGL